MGFKENLASEYLCDNATQTPNVNFPIVGDAQDDLRCAIASCLDVVSGFIVEENT